MGGTPVPHRVPGVTDVIAFNVRGLLELIGEFERMSSEVREHPIRTLAPQLLHEARSIQPGSPSEQRLGS